MYLRNETRLPTSLLESSNPGCSSLSVHAASEDSSFAPSVVVVVEGSGVRSQAGGREGRTEGKGQVWEEGTREGEGLGSYEAK